MTNPLSSSALATLRAKAARGLSITFDEVAQFVASVRKSYTAAAQASREKAPSGEKKSRVKAPEQSIDFF